MSTRPVRRRSFGNVRNPHAHAAVIEAAVEILLDSGPAGASIDAIARRAGTSKPTIYRWWPTKGDLLMEVYQREMVRSLPPTPDLGSVHDDLVMLRRQVWQAWRDTAAGHAFVALVAEAQGRPEMQRTIRERFGPARRARTLEIFQRAIDRGEFHPRADLGVLVDACHGFDWYRLLTGQIDDDQDVIEESVRVQLLGCTSTPASR